MTRHYLIYKHCRLNYRYDVTRRYLIYKHCRLNYIYDMTRHCLIYKHCSLNYRYDVTRHYLKYKHCRPNYRYDVTRHYVLMIKLTCFHRAHSRVITQETASTTICLVHKHITISDRITTRDLHTIPCLTRVAEEPFLVGVPAYPGRWVNPTL